MLARRPAPSAVPLHPGTLKSFPVSPVFPVKNPPPKKKLRVFVSFVVNQSL